MTPDNDSEITLDSVVTDLQSSPAQVETLAAEKEELFFGRSREEVIVQGMTQDLRERKTYASRIYCLVVGWLLCRVLLLLLQGFDTGTYFHLSDAILLAAIGATTVNVLGMLYVVANYLFPKTLKIERDRQKGTGRAQT